MSELATVVERARELAEGIVREIPLLPNYFSIMTKALGVSEAAVQYEVELADRFEQALLAERRLVFEEAAKIVCYYCAATETYGESVSGHHMKGGWESTCQATDLRAAAEKEGEAK